MPRTYQDLKERIDAIALNMLPTVRSPTGDYVQSEIDAIKSFVLLSHAEIESFVEEIAMDVLDRAERQWSGKRAISPVLSRIVTYWIASKGKEPELLSTETVASAIRFYREEVLKPNHGIRVRNLLSVLLPLGLNFDDFDATVLPTFNTFGEERGLIAHKSWRARREIDPNNEEQRLKQILLPEISRIYQRLQALAAP